MGNPKNRFIAICLSLFLLSFFCPQPANGQGMTEKCLIVSDIHFAPLYGSTNPSLQSKLEKASYAEWKKYFVSNPAQMAISTRLYGKDANYAIIVSGLINMKKTLPKPAFIIIAGDFIWHNATPADSILKKKTIGFIAQLFKEKFPNTPIIPAMGNNDTYGNDYDLQDPKFLNDFANAWAPNLPKASGDQLKAQGYYTWQYGNLTLMVVNSAPVNNGTYYPQQAGPMLTWVESNLANAGNNNFWFITHIPPGLNGLGVSNFWNLGYTQQFVNSVVKYASKVKFGVASHTHLNDFKVFYDASASPQPVAYMRVVPSICSNHSNNPSFEVAEFDKTTNEVLKETNYYLNLATAPPHADTTTAWKSTLSLPTSLKLKQLNATGLSNFISTVKTDKTGQSLSNYIKFYTVGTKIDSAYRINRANYLYYLKADSLKGN